MAHQSVKKLYSCLPKFLLTVLAASWSQSSQAMTCSELLLPKPYLVSSFFVQTKHPKFDQVYNEQILDLLESSSFQAYLKDKNIDPSHLTDFKSKTLIVEQYMDHQLRKYFNQNILADEKSQVMADILKIRGHQMKYRNPYLILKEQSHLNLVRLIDSLTKYPPIRSLTVPLKIEEITQKLNVSLVHNTHHLSEVPNYPLVSPHILESIGLPRFGHSRLPFHKTIQSDRQVNFFALIEKSGQLNQNGHKTDYGTYGLKLKTLASEQEAWISPLVQHSKQLQTAVGNESLQKILDRHAHSEASLSAMKYKGSDHNRDFNLDLSAEMHKWDFTVSDFQTLVRTTVRNELERLYATNAYMYSVTVRKIEKMNMQELNAYIMELFKTRYGYEGSFEGRVPVAVLPHQLEKVGQE